MFKGVCACVRACVDVSVCLYVCAHAHARARVIGWDGQGEGGIECVGWGIHWCRELMQCRSGRSGRALPQAHGL